MNETLKLLLIRVASIHPFYCLLTTLLCSDNTQSKSTTSTWNISLNPLMRLYIAKWQHCLNLMQPYYLATSGAYSFSYVFEVYFHCLLSPWRIRGRFWHTLKHWLIYQQSIHTSTNILFMSRLPCQITHNNVCRTVAPPLILNATLAVHPHNQGHPFKAPWHHTPLLFFY